MIEFLDPFLLSANMEVIIDQERCMGVAVCTGECETVFSFTFVESDKYFNKSIGIVEVKEWGKT